jgi:glutathione synthase/RimK-type ligase-like ATP-grasp enzyme
MNKLFTRRKNKFTLFRPMILSRHPSHDVFRSRFKKINLLPYKSVIRFGSSTEVEDTFDNGGNRIEINTIQSIKTSANKLLMKEKFTEAGVKTAPWKQHCPIEGLTGLEFPIVAKSHYGSKGKGNTLLKTSEEYDQWVGNKNLSNYIFEKFVNYGHEFRLHVTEDGCFYTCRKALKENVPENEKWRRHDDICVWFLEENESFHKPNSWDDIVNDCVKALKSIGADILSFDVKVQTPYNKKGEPREYQDYILLECNSASSMGNIEGEDLSVCAQKYIEMLPKLIIKKAIKNGK